MRVTYYGELDPFSGSIRHRVADLPRVVADLQAALLLSDVVIVPPGNLLEHPLTLPAFEALAPFVAAGRLTTTTDPSSPGPHALLDERVALHLDERARGVSPPMSPRSIRSRPPRPPGPVAVEHLRGIEEVRRRWHDVLPPAWTLARDVDTQVVGFADRLLRFCAETRNPSPGTRALQRAVDRVLQAGRARPDRGTLLAYLAARRDDLPPREVSRLALAVQSAFFAMGAAVHGPRPGSRHTGPVAHLFPGPFAGLLLQHGRQVDALDRPPYDWDLAPGRLDQRFRRLGLDRRRVLAAGPRALLDVARSPEWQAVVALLDGPEPPPDLERALAALFRRAPDFRDALGLVGTVLPRAPESLRSPPPALPAPWQLATHALLGAAVADRTGDGAAVLDLRTLRLSRGAIMAALTRPEAHLVTILIVAGEVGVGLHDVKQLSLDVDRLAATAETPLDHAWAPQARERADLDAARLNRVNVRKTRVNAALAPLGLRIEATPGRGRWRLVAGPPAVEEAVRLDGTVWDLLGTAAPPQAPADLSPQQARLWSALAEVAPRHVAVPALARALGKPEDERGLRQTVGALGKLGARLVALGGPVGVVRFRRGLYALMPAHAVDHAAGEVL